MAKIQQTIKFKEFNIVRTYNDDSLDDRSDKALDAYKDTISETGAVAFQDDDKIVHVLPISLFLTSRMEIKEVIGNSKRKSIKNET